MRLRLVDGFPFGPLAVERPDDERVKLIVFMPGLTCHTVHNHKDSGRLVIAYVDTMDRAMGRYCFQTVWGGVAGPSAAFKISADTAGTKLSTEMITGTPEPYRTTARILLQAYQITGGQHYVAFASEILRRREDTAVPIKAEIASILRGFGIEKYAGPVQFRHAVGRLELGFYAMRNDAFALRFLMFHDLGIEDVHMEAVRNMHARIVGKRRPLTHRQRRYMAAIENMCVSKRLAATQKVISGLI